jgi:hypothetical protein
MWGISIRMWSICSSQKSFIGYLFCTCLVKGIDKQFVVKKNIFLYISSVKKLQGHQNLGKGRVN